MGVPRALVVTVAALTAGAGLVHAAAAGTHAGDDTLVRLFGAIAVGQLAVAGLVALGGSTRTLLASAGLNLAVAGGWLLSRTRGLPIDSLAGPEPVGTQDLAATVLEVLAAAAALAAWRGWRPPVLERARWLPAAVLVPALIGVTAPHTHSASHDHDHGEAHDHAEVAGAGAADQARALAADPVFAGADATHATEAQLAAAKELIEVTRAAAARFTDESSVEAAGYRSIGDGRFTRYEHFVHPDYLDDGRVLDPTFVESLVFEDTPDGSRLASAMFILPTGATMADVPDIAGALTVWHDHQNLCWRDDGTLGGILVDGECRPGGTFRATPPMLHVWLVAHECGPFAGIEGSHGQSCHHAH